MRGGDRNSHRARGLSLERDAQIVRLYLVGRRFPEIAEEVGLSLRAVQASYARSLKRGIVPIRETNEMRKEALGRLDIMRRRMFEDLEAATTIEQRGLVIDRLVKIETRQATMLGLDVPQRMAVALYPDNIPDDNVTVEELSRLEPDELQTLFRLMQKAKGGVIENTATPLPAPPFDGEEAEALPAPEPAACARRAGAGSRTRADALYRAAR